MGRRGEKEGEGGREGGRVGVREKIVCTSIYTPSSVYFHLTLELSVFLLLSLRCLSPSGYAW